MSSQRNKFRNEDGDELNEREAFRMCKRKLKLKSSKAGKYTARLNQRKYKCDVCGHWHLTKSGVK